MKVDEGLGDILWSEVDHDGCSGSVLKLGWFVYSGMKWSVKVWSEDGVEGYRFTGVER